MKRSCVLLALAVFVVPLVAGAQTVVPSSQTPLSPAEQNFSTTASAAVTSLYPTPADAEKAGYFRFNNEDRSGAISYVNPNYFTSPDPSHPQQLWYDVQGRLLGGDWSQVMDPSTDLPTLFGLSAGRFHRIPLHVHYGVKKPDGSIDYGLYVRAADFRAAGLDPLHPTAADLVKLGKVTAVDQVAFVFAIPDNWDAQMWVIPNAAGPFAEMNPAVKPSPNQGKAPSERQT